MGEYYSCEYINLNNQFIIMKLHLPIALLAAVVGAMSFAQAADWQIDRTSGAQITEGNYNDNDVIVNVTGGDFSKYNMGVNGQYATTNGVVGGASATDSIPNTLTEYSDIYLNVTGGSNIGTLVGQCEPWPIKVTGSTNISVSGGKITTLVGGALYNSGKTGFTSVGNGVAGLEKNGNTNTTFWAYKSEADPDINISVSGNAVIGQIRGGHSSDSAHVYDAVRYALNQDSKVSNGTAYKTLMADKNWAVAGDVNIKIEGGEIGRGQTKAAIIGGGGSGHSVDGAVNIDISGGTIYSNVFAGSNNIFTEVGSTNIKISGGEIQGNVYGGGNLDDGPASAVTNKFSEYAGPTVKGNTEVVLSGGTVKGSVYGAGSGDVVECNTKVVLTGEGTTVDGYIYGGGKTNDDKGVKTDSVVKGNRILAFESYTGSMNWNQYKDFNVLEFTDTTAADMSGASNDITSSVKINNSTVTDNNADRKMGKLTLVDSGKYENSGKVTVDRIVAGNTAIIQEGAPTEITKSDSVVVNKGEMTIGDIWNIATANNANSEGYSKLTLENSGADATLIIKGSTRNLGGAIDSNNSINLHQTGGTVELDNESSLSFNLVGEGNTGKLVHSGDGAVHITGGANGQDQAILDSSYVVEQTGNGSLMLDGTFRSTSGNKLNVAIKQTGAGSIGLDAMFTASVSAGSTFTVQQSGGGKVTVEEDGIFTKVDVRNLSTFENMASINVVEVAVNGATLSTSGALNIKVKENLYLKDATLAVNTNSFTSSNAAILMYIGSQITSLDCDAYNIVFGQDTEGLDAMLAGEKLGQTFSVSLITGFDDAAALLAKDLCAAFDKDMLTLQAVDAKGQLIDLLVHDAALSFNGGAIVLSGTASVPEPTTATLSLLALAALAARRRRK